MSTKRCVEFFLLFCLKLELFAKIKKDSSFYTLTETRVINNSRSKQNQKSCKHVFLNSGKTEMCAKFQQRILYSTIVGARQSSKFFRQIAWFLGNKRALSKFKYLILHHLISIFKLQNSWPVKLNFMLTT